MKKQNFDSSNLLVFIYKKRKPILIITTLGIIISIIVSLIITPKYESTVILFPAKSSSVSQTLLTQGRSNNNLLELGGENEVEQLMQILKSQKIKNKIISKYNLFKHYEINPSTKYPKTTLFNRYKKNIKIKRTEFMSIKINVLDKDPKIAANIANDIANLIDTAMREMKIDRAREAMNIVKKRYQSQEKELDSLDAKLKKIRMLGINNYESQARAYNEAYSLAIAEGKVNGAKKLKEKMKLLSKYGGTYVRLRDEIYRANRRKTELEQKYNEAKIDAKLNMPNKFIVDRATISEKKAYPIRWLIVVISALSTFIFSILTLLIIDSVKTLRFKD